MLDEALLARFIESFGKFEDLIASNPVPHELDGGTDAEFGFQRWKPVAHKTDVNALNDVYARIPGPLPALYEQLVLSYRWLEVYLNDHLRLLANPPGPGLLGLTRNMAADPAFVNVLFPLGLVPFGKAGDSYDPVCFDLSNRVNDVDCRIVRVEHESVLCNGRVGETWVLSDSFRSLVDSYANGGEKAAAASGG
jgi:hypothetical protein